uniref:Uncharacterized protein n=1 Tax=Oryza rufipogon TaxID=4529 RepID=A0A0E0PJS3_ORYRU
MKWGPHVITLPSLVSSLSRRLQPRARGRTEEQRAAARRPEPEQLGARRGEPRRITGGPPAAAAKRGDRSARGTTARVGAEILNSAAAR